MPDQGVMPRLDYWQSWVVGENFKLFFVVQTWILHISSAIQRVLIFS